MIIIAFENATEFKYFGTSTSNQNCMYVKIKCVLNSENAYYFWAQNSCFPVWCRKF